jgi:uncharacterized protein YlxW (UPF0749 family)
MMSIFGATATTTGAAVSAALWPITIMIGLAVGVAVVLTQLTKAKNALSKAAKESAKSLDHFNSELAEAKSRVNELKNAIE